MGKLCFGMEQNQAIGDEIEAGNAPGGKKSQKSSAGKKPEKAWG